MATFEKETDSAEDSVPIKLDGQALEDALRKQLEFYFSRQNLSTDAYLTSHMNAQRYVPIEVIANFRKVKSLTEDKELLVKVARQCKNLACDETGRMVRPTLKMERKTLLLRDIPSSTPIEEVKAIFDKNCGKVVGIRGDIGDTWYVNFETEEECVETAMQLAGKTFQGKPIHCRVKSENLLRGYFFHPGQPKDLSSISSPRYPQNNGLFNVPVGYVPFPDQPYMIPYSQPWQNNVYPSLDPSQAQDFPRGRGRRTDSTQQARKGHGPFPPGTRRKKGQYRKQRGEPKGVQRQVPEPELGPEHFPALPTTKKPQTAGYTKPFRKYTREQMAEVVQELSRRGIPRPESLPSPQDCLVVRSSANTSCQLMEPFPVIYPASPSPLLAAQPHHSSELPPFFDLDTGLPAEQLVLDPSLMPDPSGLPFEEVHPSEMQYLPQGEPIEIPQPEAEEPPVQFSSPQATEPIEPSQPENQPPVSQSPQAPATTPPVPSNTTAPPAKPQHRYYSRSGRGGPRRYAQKYAQKGKFVEKQTSHSTGTKGEPDQKKNHNEKKTAAAVVKAAEAAEASKSKPPSKAPPKPQNVPKNVGPPRSAGRGRPVYKSKNRKGGSSRFAKTDKAYKQTSSVASPASASTSSSSTSTPQSPTKLSYADITRRAQVNYKPSTPGK